MSETAAPEIRARRGDLVIVELRPSYTTASYAREEQPLEYQLMKVTNLFRDGRIKRVCDTRYGGESYTRPYNELLHATGRHWLLPAADWDTERAQRIAAAHTYPDGDTPRAYPSLDAAREALAPARHGYTDTVVSADGPFQVRIARARYDRDPYERRVCENAEAVQGVIRELLSEARVGMTEADARVVAERVDEACALAARDGFVSMELVGSSVTLRPVR